MATEAAIQTINTISVSDFLKSEALQLHSSEHPGMMLVSMPLDGKNFLSWSRAVRRALGAKSKLDFITGTCAKPVGDPELLQQWTRVDCHDKSTYFKLHGVPKWYKELNEQKNKSVEGANRVNVVQGPELKLQKEVQSEDKPSINDMVVELMKMLKKLPIDHIQAICSEYFAGMHYCTFTGIEHLNPSSWILDSGATSHMCSDVNAFHTLSKSSLTSSIYLPDGTSTQVKQSGHISLSNGLILKDVLYVPTFQSNLISDRMTSEMVAVAKQTKHLYVLNKQSFDVAFIKWFLPVSSNFVSRVIESDALLWYKRLYDLDTNKLIVSRDVIFHENTFPLQSPSIQALDTTLPLVPNTEVIPDVIRTLTVHISSPQSTDHMSYTSVLAIASPSLAHDSIS
ncbi:UNVERIFIED_CONTAM: hypothetical protein Scaly_2428800 [Sesamum calycinum]|uniref:Retrotransposon Copia-like N-terminal domain-containing protein n=1 Tax=Sesamum calycinum TaxID=2727403 RepID=A0AAW2LZ76_9LAMI